MAKPFISILLLLSLNYGYSQSLTPVVFASGGGVYVNKYRISYTIGEPVVETFNSFGYILTQGFHQWPVVFISAINPSITQRYEVKVFPNPASEKVTVSFNNLILSRDCKAEIYNILGQKNIIPFLRDRTTDTDVFEFDLSDLDRGVFIIKFIDPKLEKGYIDFRIVKVR
jgi:hypothetical protein